MVKELVVKRFAGTVHYSLDRLGDTPLHKDSRWAEVDRLPVPEDMVLSAAVKAYEEGTLKRPEPPPAAERKERRDRSWKVEAPGPAFPTYTDDRLRSMEWTKSRNVPSKI